MTDFQTVRLELDVRGFATLWLDRADKNNAFNGAMIRELIQALDQVKDRPELRFLILRGRGRHFSAGADLAWMREAAELDAAVEQWIANLQLNSPQAMKATKDLLEEVGSGTLGPDLRRYTESAIARLRVSQEGQEGLRAFLEKRSPAWQEKQA